MSSTTFSRWWCHTCIVEGLSRWKRTCLTYWSCCQLLVCSSWGRYRDIVNSSALNTSTWIMQSASTRLPRFMVRWSWAHFVKVTSCSRCLLCWKERALGACCWDPLGPDKETTPFRHWLTARVTHFWRSWKPPWLNDYALSTSLPESEDDMADAVERRQK